MFGESRGDHVADTILSALRTSAAGLSRTEISDLFARHMDAYADRRIAPGAGARGLDYGGHRPDQGPA